jgi:hypothetical protein
MLKKVAVAAFYVVIIAVLSALMLLGAASIEGAPIGKLLTF